MFGLLALSVSESNIAKLLDGAASREILPLKLSLPQDSNSEILDSSLMSLVLSLKKERVKLI